jgi:hypothetical protein
MAGMACYLECFTTAIIITGSLIQRSLSYKNYISSSSALFMIAVFGGVTDPALQTKAQQQPVII